MSDERIDPKEVHMPDQVYDRVLRMLIDSVLREKNKMKAGEVGLTSRENKMRGESND